MLAKPPIFLEEVISQNSEEYSAKSKDRSKSRGKRKETSLRIGQPPPPPSAPPLPTTENDNQSVHSAASRRSKGKKPKESSLSRPKIMGSRDEDTHSQHSQGSSRSRNHSKKKENSFTSRPRAPSPKKVESAIADDPYIPNRFSDVLDEPEESVVIKLTELEEMAPGVRQPKPKAQTVQKTESQLKTQNKPKYSPFANFDQPEPQPRIETTKPSKTQKPSQVSRPAQLRGALDQFEQRIVQPEPQFIQTREPQMPRITSIEESTLKETKSRRRSIFGAKNEEMSNASKLTHTISNSQVFSVQDSSRRKSKSRLREIFDKSKQKDKKKQQAPKMTVTEPQPKPQSPQQPQMINTQLNQTRQEVTERGNASSVGWSTSELQSKSIKPEVKNKMVQLERKAPDDDNFMLESSKSALDITVSHHVPHEEKEDRSRDSLNFEFEPEKRKGVTVTSKLKYSNDTKLPADLPTTSNPLVSDHRPQELPMTSQPLTSAVSKKEQNLPQVKGDTLVSKELDEMEKILKENDEYIKASGVLALSQSGEAKPDRNISGSGYLFHFDDQEIHEKASPVTASNPYQKQQPWHQIVPQHQHPTIKEVERSKPTKEDRARQEAELAERKREEERARREKQERDRRQRVQRQRRDQEDREQREREERKRRQRDEEKRRARQRQEQQREQKERQQFKRRQQEQFDRIKREKQEQKMLRRKREEEQKERKRIEDQERQKQFERQSRKRQERQEQKMRQNRLKEEEPPSIQRIQSIVSRDLSENSSDRSRKSSRKGGKKEGSIGRTKKEGSIGMGKHRAFVEPQAPRAEESFYEESQRQKGNDSSVFKGLQQMEKSKEEKKPKIKNFSDDEGEPDFKPKSKTDMNFYQMQSMKSKPPSSRPPLSRKSNASNSKSHEKRPKENSLGKKKHTPYQPQHHFQQQQQQAPAKKMTLMERAMKNNDSSDYSQDSFRSRDDFSSRSRQSVGSRSSKKSGGKKESTIAIKLNKHVPMIQSKYSRPPQRQSSVDSSDEGVTDESRYETAQRQRQLSRERQQRIKEQMNQRVVVSKNCMFIDERGRLVQKDLVIRGKEVYGRPSNIDNSTSEATDRMRRSREQRRSRSRQRGQNGSRLSRQTSGEMTDSQFSSTNTFYQNNSRPTNGSYYPTGQQHWGNNQSLREFMKPVQEVPNYHQPYPEQTYTPQNNTYNPAPQNQQMTLNDMFKRRSDESQVSMQSSGSRRSLHRTERSRNKR